MLRPGRPGFDTRQKQGISLFATAHPASYTMGTGGFTPPIRLHGVVLG
jgi:hypothetical protein